MKILVGLGNPGRQYELTRHNIGFMALDYLLERLSVGPGMQPTPERPLVLNNSWRERFSALLGEGSVPSLPDDGRVLLMKPQTFMNRSGDSIGEAMRFYKLSPADVVVLHDDIDLPFGSLRLKQGGGDGGHNGLKSLSTCLGSPNFFRIRLGVGRPPGSPGPGGGSASASASAASLQQGAASNRSATQADSSKAASPPSACAQGAAASPDVSSWVLGRFLSSDMPQVESLTQRGAKAALCLLELGLTKAQQRFHGAGAS